MVVARVRHQTVYRCQIINFTGCLLPRLVVKATALLIDIYQAFSMFYILSSSWFGYFRF